MMEFPLKTPLYISMALALFNISLSRIHVIALLSTKLVNSYTGLPIFIRKQLNASCNISKPKETVHPGLNITLALRLSVLVVITLIYITILASMSLCIIRIIHFGRTSTLLILHEFLLHSIKFEFNYFS